MLCHIYNVQGALQDFRPLRRCGWREKKRNKMARNARAGLNHIGMAGRSEERPRTSSGFRGSSRCSHGSRCQRARERAGINSLHWTPSITIDSPPESSTLLKPNSRSVVKFWHQIR